MLLTDFKGKSTWFSPDLVEHISWESDDNVRKSKSQWKGYKHVINEAKKIFHRITPNRTYKNFDKVVKIKGDANRILVTEIISELHRKVESNEINIYKIGIDYIVPNVYFWVEIEDNDFQGIEKLEAIFLELNLKFNVSELFIKCLINEKSLELEMPNDFLRLKIKSHHYVH